MAERAPEIEHAFVTKPIGLKELTDDVAKIGMYWLLVNRHQ
jgi:hypothetical protein